MCRCTLTFQRHEDKRGWLCSSFGGKTGIILKLLALETTDRQGTVAAFEDGMLQLEAPLSPQDKRSAQTLVPSIQQLFSELNWSFAQLDAVAVAIGPGSFTGLRVGVTTAKTIAYTLAIPVLGINTLDAMACGLGTTCKDRIVTTGIDAQRQDIAAAFYYIDEQGQIVRLSDGYQVIPVVNWLNDEKSTDDSKNKEYEKNTERGNLFYSGLVYQKIQAAWSKDYIFCSPILKRWQTRVSADIQCRFAAQEYWAPKSCFVAQLAYERMLRNETDNLWSLSPLYSRPSAAEERAAQKSG